MCARTGINGVIFDAALMPCWVCVGNRMRDDSYPELVAEARGGKPYRALHHREPSPTFFGPYFRSIYRKPGFWPGLLSCCAFGTALAFKNGPLYAVEVAGGTVAAVVMLVYAIWLLQRRRR